VIRPSRTPYNNPNWVVDKKGTDQNGVKKNRLVIDFRKLNRRTVDYRYSIPTISTILSNMDESHFCTTLNLKSGFYQIKLAKKTGKAQPFL